MSEMPGTTSVKYPAQWRANYPNEFTTLEKNELLTYYMEMIIKSFSKNDIKIYFDKYSKTIGSKNLIALIEDKYKLNFNENNILNLKNIAETKITFEKLLSDNKGKLIYIDFWASWCAPCIKLFPESFKLKSEYRDKGVVFFYFSKDEDQTKWKNASRKYSLNENESFLIDNQFTSSLIDELKIQSIPRYLLYDSSGKLIHSNAPNPEGKEIRILLNRELAKIYK